MIDQWSIDPEKIEAWSNSIGVQEFLVSHFGVTFHHHRSQLSPIITCLTHDNS